MKPKTFGIFIAPMLKEGEANAISTQSLMLRTGLSERQLRQQIFNERAAEQPILSRKGNGGGYYLPEKPEEAAAFAKFMEKEAKSHYVSTAAARRIAQQCKGQVEIGL